MNLEVLTPAGTVLHREVDIVVAEGTGGSFALEPRHVDTAAELAPGILTARAGEEESFVAVAGGILTKAGEQVSVATPAAVEGTDLEGLRALVAERYRRAEERELAARVASSRLETDIVQRMAEWEEGRG